MSTDASTRSSSAYIEERDWRNLLRDIHSGQVLPVIGPELVTIPLPGGNKVTLYSHLARELAKLLDIDLSPHRRPALNELACTALLAGISSKELYDEIRELIDNLSMPLPEALIDLASVTDFNLFISTTFDPLMCQVFEQVHPGFTPQRNTMEFHPSNPRDLTHSLPRPFLYQILGTHNTYPYFAVWEEDYIEYLCGLLMAQDNLRVLFDQLRNRDLILIGSPFSDWIVRFFLRIAKGKRFSEPRDHQRFDYVADDPVSIAPPTIFFFERQVGSTRIIPGDPCLFAAELARRWRERYGVAAQGDFLERLSDDLPRGAVFISYSRDDLGSASRFAQGLLASQVPVWMDKGRITAGENYERSLEHAVKNDASFFISLISNATEQNPERYVHRERAWAAQRHVDGFVFYIPVLIEELSEVRQEPSIFEKIHRESMPGGRISSAFAQRMHKLIEEYRQSGQPRG